MTTALASFFLGHEFRHPRGFDAVSRWLDESVVKRRLMLEIPQDWFFSNRQMVVTCLNLDQNHLLIRRRLPDLVGWKSSQS